MPRAVRGRGEVIRAPPDIVDDELEVVRCRRDVDHCLEAFRASPVMREKQRWKESVVSYAYEERVVYLFVIW